MTRAVVEASGVIRKLEKPAQAEQVTTAADVQDPEKLARLVQGLRTEVAALKGAHRPRTIDFVGVVCTGSGVSPQTVRFEHGFGSAVHYWPIGWESSTSAALDTIKNADATNDNTLVLYVYSAGILSLRVEAQG